MKTPRDLLPMEDLFSYDEFEKWTGVSYKDIMEVLTSCEEEPPPIVMDDSNKKSMPVETMQVQPIDLSEPPLDLRVPHVKQRNNMG